MALKFVVLLALGAFSAAEDDKKWVWGDNRRDGTSREARYEVYEGEGPFRPSYPTGGSVGYNERPGYGNRPGFRPDFVPNKRPGGLYGGGPTGSYGHSHLGSQYPDNSGPGILTGPVPSWVKEGPFKNYDRCKCTEKFNCNTPGISYGHCDAGKQYCCYATKKIDQLGEPLPSKPVHSIENGILVGPGGPVDGPGDYPRPGNYPRPGPGGIGGPISNRPVHSIENGILVGPGGPYDRPGGGRPGGGRPGGYGGYAGGFGRSAKN